MAVLTYIIKNTSKEVVVKIDTVDGATGVIALTSLASADQVLGATGAAGATGPVVNIAKIIFTGELGSAIRITRNGENIFAGAPENAPFLDLVGNGISENRQNNKDIVIIKEGATGFANVPVTGYLVLHKQEGFYSKVEYEKYGSYDDETIVGAQNISGSPDYTG
jgi:hypothetical protein